MPDLIYHNLAPPGGAGALQFLKQEYGVTARVSGSDLVIPESEASRAFPLTGVLTRHAQIELTSCGDEEIAAAMAKQVSSPQPNLGDVTINVPEEFGKISDAVRALESLAAAPPSDLANVIAREVLPLVRSLGATHVTAVTVDPHRAQRIISLTKILCLSQRHGFAAAEQLFRAGRENPNVEPLRSVLPSPFDLPPFVDALMRFAPLVLTLTARRLNCVWHFQAPAMWNFPRILCNGLLSEFSLQLAPLASDAHLFGLSGLVGMNEAAVWQYLSLIVAGVDRLFGWLGDPRNFQAEDGTVDLLRQIQGFGAIHLFFADLCALQFATYSHNRISYAMSALDKLANLRIELGGATGPDKAAFSRLCSADQGRSLAGLIKKRCEERNYGELGKRLAACVTRVYEGLHQHLSEQGAAYKASEQARVDRLWSQRNIRHGTFLRGAQFEKLFLEASGTVPTTLASVPFLLAIGFICDPGAFLRYDPTIGP